MVTSTQIAPESLVARIIEEIESNPEAQRLLLRALLTEEFLRVPERLDRIEAELAEAKADRADIRNELEIAKTERAEAKADRADIRNELEIAKADRADIRNELEIAKTERSQMRDDIAMLKGDMLEVRLHRRIRSLVSQRLRLRRGRIMQSLVQETRSDFSDAVEDALANGLISDEQETRIDCHRHHIAGCPQVGWSSDMDSCGSLQQRATERYRAGLGDGGRPKRGVWRGSRGRRGRIQHPRARQ